MNVEDKRMVKQHPLNLRQAAVESGVCERTLKRFVAQDKLRAVRRPNGHYKILRPDLDAFLKWYRGEEQ